MHQGQDALELEPRSNAALRARWHVRRLLESWGLEELRDPVLLLTSEVVTNALLHSGTSLTVLLPGDAGGVVEVRLPGTPLELPVSGREHHDGLMREFRLLAPAGPADRHAVPTRLVELTDVLGRQYAAASAHCASADLMTMERPALLECFGSWYLDQFVVQCDGGAPTPWSGPLTLGG